MDTKSSEKQRKRAEKWQINYFKMLLSETNEDDKVILTKYKEERQ